MFNALTAVTLCGTTIFALWIRRFTWTNPWESAVTLSIMLQGAAFLLTIPLANPIGLWLADHIGAHNLEDVIAHDLYLVAASSVAYHALYSLSDDEHLPRRFRVLIEVPATVALPLLLMTYMRSEAVSVPYYDMFAANDPSLGPYWIILTAFVGYLLAASVWEFAILYQHPDYRREVRWYMVAGFSGVLACVIRGVNHWLHLPTSLIWGTIAACTSIYALAAAWAWKHPVEVDHPDPVGPEPLPAA